MASSLLMLLDDLATVLDDVSVMTKVAVKKTAGVLGDDLALNAEQVAGVVADRELPVVWAVAKGSLVNKCVLVPAALIISTFTPWAITPLLMLGGAYLCYEGFEKIYHKLFHQKESQTHHKELVQAIADPTVDMVIFEKNKIKGAVRTDFILSAEIIVISLGTVAESTFMKQLSVLSGISLIMTIGVYGLVAGIVKLDDLGFHLRRQPTVLAMRVGTAILLIAPYLMKSLSVLGTTAMFLVGGGIISHGFHAVDDWANQVAPYFGVVSGLVPILVHLVVGLFTGAVTLILVSLIKSYCFPRR